LDVEREGQRVVELNALDEQFMANVLLGIGGCRQTVDAVDDVVQLNAGIGECGSGFSRLFGIELC